MSAQCSKTAWLSSKLKQFALDEEIYLNYIESVLDGEEDRCEKISALEAILGEVLSDNEVKTQCMEIIEMYDSQDNSGAIEIKTSIEDTEEALVKLLENNIRTVVTVPNKTNKLNSDDEDSDLVKMRKNILSQYAQKEANSEEENDDLDIEHNTNASSVLALKKEQRERAKEQSLRKKEKDKEDREKQKQLAQERKDAKKKKAQKVERKR